MSLQWTLVAGFLYAEIGVVLLLLFPFISATRWNKIFKSRIVSAFATFSTIYFRASVGILLLLFVDALRSQHHYAPNEDSSTGGGPLADMQHNMKLFRSQRNLYVSGFALFLVFVIRRLVILLASQATLTAESEAAMRQAKSAGEAAQRLLDEAGDKEGAGGDENEECRKLRLRLDDVTEDAEKAKDKIRALENEINEVKSRAEITSEEYNQLLLEHTKLDLRLSVSGEKDD